MAEASLTLEGATNDSFETTLTVTDPTADRTITFDATGTVALTSDITAIDVDFAGDIVVLVQLLMHRHLL